MKVYAIKYYIPYEVDEVRELFFDIIDAKNSIDEEIKESSYEYKKDSFYDYGFFDQWGNGYYIEKFTIQGKIKA